MPADPHPQPDLDRSDIEHRLSEHWAPTHVWLNHGYLAGDDADSHIDTLARFCAPDHICYVTCPMWQTNTSALAAMEEELQEFRQQDGSPYKLTALPWPDAIYLKRASACRPPMPTS